jgi:hypothetical protein
MDRLERDVFSRSRELKRGACASRLIETLDESLALEESAASKHVARAQGLVALSENLSVLRNKLGIAVDDVMASFYDDLTHAFDAAADEVLAFVRPRRSRFAGHGADPEDRAFLSDVLETRLGAAVDALGKRLIARARALLSQPASALGTDPDLLDARLHAAADRALSYYVGLQRGALRAGGLSRFFQDILPKAELEPQAIAQGLSTARVDPLTELRPTLVEGLLEVVTMLDRERLAALGRARRDEELLRSRVYAPLRALRATLAELT